jgi:amino acid adenylation domain-containing protein
VTKAAESAQLRESHKGMSLAKLRALSAAKGKRASLRPVVPVARGARSPLACGQERLWILDQLGFSGSAYNMPLVLHLEGDLDVAALEQALNQLIDRHEILRTRFTESSGGVVQLTDPPSPLILRVVDLSALDEADKHRREIQLRDAEANVCFSLVAGPLFRALLLKRETRDHLLLLTAHHIVTDGWSSAVLIRELATSYDAHVRGEEPNLPLLEVQYADYAHWQQSLLAQADFQARVDWWRQHLQGAPAHLELPLDRPRPHAVSDKGGEIRFAFDAELTGALKALARRNDATLAMVLHAAWSVLMYRLSGQTDIVVGVPVANRLRPELEGLIGFFVNTLAIRLRMDDDPRVAELFRRVRDETLSAQAHQEVPFERVVQALQPTRSLSYNPIFQVMFVLQNTAQTETRVPGLTITKEEVSAPGAQFDLSLSCRETADGLSGGISFASDLFDAPTIESWAACLKCLLISMTQHPEQRVSELPLLDETNRNRVLEQFNGNTEDSAVDGTIVSAFDRQVARTPDAEALVGSGKVLTFREFDRKACRLARLLKTNGVGAEDRVGLCMDRGAEMVIAWLGILKVGAACVPLDPSLPEGRLTYLLEDSGPKAVVTENAYAARWGNLVAQVIVMDDAATPAADDVDLLALQSPVPEERLAYVIYTSGSTGKPKGVMIEHRDVVNLWAGLETVYRSASPVGRVALNASLSFDASVQQLVQLLSGRALVPVPESVRRDATLMMRFLREHRIDAIDCTPSQLKSWIEAGFLDGAAGPVRLVLVGGESIDRELWARLAAASEITFVNVYGPTECTVDATATIIRGDSGPPHIGAPMKNRRVYILDQHDEPVPIGVAGEICIGGAGIARGYLNREDLTAERFVRDPFDARPARRLYRTGDLARWRANGVIEYLGRNDGQVKIRGFRIELGEIESQLRLHPQVREAVVLVQEALRGDARLVAYVIPRSEPAQFVPPLRDHLKKSLPDYMIPSGWMTLDHLPLTPSGKVDRRALPVVSGRNRELRQFVPPQNALQGDLAQVWREVLRVEQVGIHDNFFELGGHSLLATQVAARVRAALSVEMPIRLLFEHPTIEGLAAELETLRQSRMLERIGHGGNDIEELLATVASIPDGRVMELLEELRGRHDQDGRLD